MPALIALLSVLFSAALQDHPTPARPCSPTSLCPFARPSINQPHCHHDAPTATPCAPRNTCVHVPPHNCPHANIRQPGSTHTAVQLERAGIICQLNARTSVLAAANPIESQWNPKKTTIENIQLPHTLLSRFDLIFLMLDLRDEAYDRRLAHHLVALFYQSEELVEEEYMDIAVLRDYIAYARSYVNPRLSEEATQALIEAYVDVRKIGSGRGMVSVYPRQLESLIRLAEAHAKEALKQSATDPRTDIVDISILTTGISATARKRKEELAQALKKLIQSKDKTPALKYQQLFDDLRAQSDAAVTKEMFEEALRALADDDFLTVTGKTVSISLQQT
ncbi:unnamed protein product [Caretta caretta]